MTPGAASLAGLRSHRAPWLFFAGALAFYVLHLPARLYGDDVWFVHCIVHGFPFAPHFLYIPLARATTWVGAQAGLDPFFVLRLLAAAGSAAGGALLLAAGLRRGLGAGRAWALALLVAGAPSTLFFATAAELHGVHLAAVGLLAWVLAGLGPRSSTRRVLGAGLAFGLLVGTHKSGGLFLPGAVALYFLATPGRAPAARWRDLGALAVAGALSALVMLLCNLVETGRALSAEDSLSWYVDGLRGRFARGYGWRDFARYLTDDGASFAFPLVVAGAAGLGALLRRHPRRFAAGAAVLLPHLLFFALFNYPERGAYFVVLLPMLAAALVATAPARSQVPLGDGAQRRSAAAALPFAVALLAAPFTPSELVACASRAGELALLAAALGSLAWGLAFPRPYLPERAANACLLGLALLQLVGARRELAAYDRTSPLLDWARGACDENAGRAGIVLTGGFQERWILELLQRPWPAPWEGTWDFARGVRRPGPTGHSYGDPSLPEAEVLRILEAKLAADEPVWIDAAVRRFLALQPQHGGLLERIAERYRLEPVTRGGFHAERILRR